jgi:MoaA/NifB/PqqE/SkfB family radical SAM enzyme
MDPEAMNWIQVDKQGRLVLPPGLTQRYGLEPGVRIRFEEKNDAIRIYQPVTNLRKVYIEPTNRCNLTCLTCIRRSWDEELGMMPVDIFERIFADISEYNPKPSVFFGGLGEPLLHSNTIEWIARCKENGMKVEMITNGILLNEERARQLVDLKLDVLWVSIDGSKEESYADIRLGAELPNVLTNLSRLKSMRGFTFNPKPEIGIAFVAMKRNLSDLPEVIKIGKRHGAKHFMVTNVMPYTSNLQSEMLYNRTLRGITYLPSKWLPVVSFPKIDFDDDLKKETFFEVLNSGCNVEFAGQNLGEANDVCTFIGSGSLTIGWDGSVSPCPPLLHNHISYLHGKERRSYRHVVDNVRNRNLHEIWMDKEYVEYRQKVQDFAFAPCTPCGGCEISEANQEDCFGNTFPACGGCLWTQGVIQCP